MSEDTNDRFWRGLAEGDFPDTGGRATDLIQLGYSLDFGVKEYFPINGVPEPIVLKLQELGHILKQAEDCLQGLGVLMAAESERPDTATKEPE